MAPLIILPVKQSPVAHDHLCPRCNMTFNCRERECRELEEQICPFCLAEADALEMPSVRYVVALAVGFCVAALAWGVL